MSDLERNQISQIPNSTKECYIEWVAKKRLTPNDTNGIFNELLPLLFFSLKMSVPDSENVTAFVMINCLDEFISQDPDQEVLLDCDARNIFKQLEFISRLYALNSKKHKVQSKYWISYANKVLDQILDTDKKAEQPLDDYGN